MNSSLHIPTSYRNPRLLIAHLGKRRDTVLDRLLARHREAQSQMGTGVIRTDRPCRTFVEDDAGLGGRLHQLPRIDPLGQLDPQEYPAFWSPALGGCPEFAFDGFDHGLQ